MQEGVIAMEEMTFKTLVSIYPKLCLIFSKSLHRTLPHTFFLLLIYCIDRFKSTARTIIILFFYDNI